LLSAIGRRFRDAHLAAYLGNLRSALRLLERKRNLLFSELRFVHRPASLPGSRLAGFSHSEGSNFRGGTQKFSPLPYARKTVGRVVGYLKHLRDEAGVTAETAEVEVRAIRQRVHRAYRAGYEFHQSAVRSSPELLAWVLRPDYWDYRLPRLKYPAGTKAVGDQESSAC
jgi:hypothetical protein